ncbi:MAG: GspH/FimT family pseudopilin [Gemmatimonadota bacterium]
MLYETIDSTRRSGGFSIVELLTVLVIVGIVMSIATPAFGEYLDRTRTRRALDRLVADVSFARALAVERGTSAAVRLDSGGIYRVETLNADGSWAAVRTVSLQGDYPGVEFVGETTALEFSSRGIITNLGNDSYLKIGRESVRDSIFVSPAGRVYREF